MFGDSYNPENVPNILHLGGIKHEEEASSSCSTVANAVTPRSYGNGRANGNKLYSMHRYNNTEDNPSAIFDAIPSVFTGIDSWPKNTNVKCWACTLPFTGPPVFVPTNISVHRIGGKDETLMDVNGIMCSFNCANAWIDRNIPETDMETKWSMHNGLRLLYYCFTGKKVDRIIPSPSHTELQEYGGKLNRIEFRQKIQSIDPLVMLYNSSPLQYENSAIIVPHHNTKLVRVETKNICDYMRGMGSRL